MRKFDRVALTALYALVACISPEDSLTSSGVIVADSEAELSDSIFEVIGQLTLEENDDAINVSPIVSLQNTGSFLIADVRDNTVRSYDRSGQLQWQFGSTGEGPKEFQYLAGAKQRVDGNIVAVDSRKIMVFDSLQRVQETHALPLSVVYGLYPISDNLTVIAGREIGTVNPLRPNLLHFFDHDSNGITSSFFPVPGDSLISVSARAFGWMDVIVQDDMVAAVFALVDTVFIFSDEGKVHRRLPIPIENYRRVTSSVGTSSSPDEIDEWYAGLDIIVDVHWLHDGSWLVQYQQQDGTSVQWNLIGMDSGGSLIFDVRNLPQLLAVSGDSLFFAASSVGTYDVWTIARLAISYGG